MHVLHFGRLSRGKSVIFRCALAIEQQQSADAKLDGHSDPHAGQAERGNQEHRKAKADYPDTAEVQKTWHKRIACSAKGTCGNDGNAEEGFGEQFDAEYLRGKGAHLQVWGKDTKDKRAKEHHQTAGDGHQDCAHGNADVSVSFCQLIISGAVASADECRCGGADAVARHVAEAFGSDSKRICRDCDGAKRGNQHGRDDHRAVHGDFLHSDRNADFECGFQNFCIESSFLIPAQPQVRIAGAAEPGACETDDGACERCSHAGTHNTENRDEKSIENHVEDTHDGI